MQRLKIIRIDFPRLVDFSSKVIRPRLLLLILYLLGWLLLLLQEDFISHSSLDDQEGSCDETFLEELSLKHFY